MLSKWINKVICIDAIEGIKQLPDESIDCVITSPPYFNATRTYQRKGVWEKWL